jgi:RNA polymerase-binding transcription factor DksA
MPQKKSIKKAAKPQAKKAVTAKKVKPKAEKRTVHKSAGKTSKPVVKAKAKAAAPKKTAKKPAAKQKTSTKVVTIVKPAAIKTLPKAGTNKYDKHSDSMSRQKKHEEKVVNTEKKVPKKPEPIKEVKLPKINAKTSVPYQPSYKSLEQRQEQVRASEPLVRYSDVELNEFRELIQRKLDASKKELAYLQGLITRKDDMGGDESENRYMTMEDGSISMEREQLSQMASRQITYIDHLEKALIRIENKTYGICRVTGKLIDKARLRAVPHATLSLEAKLGLVKSGE